MSIWMCDCFSCQNRRAEEEKKASQIRKEIEEYIQKVKRQLLFEWPDLAKVDFEFMTPMKDVGPTVVDQYGQRTWLRDPADEISPDVTVEIKKDLDQ